MIGVLFATEEEAGPFLQTYQRGRFQGLVEEEPVEDGVVLLTLTGTGKIKATLRTERLLRQHRLRRVLHVGTCTALHEALAVGTLVAAHQVFEGDRIELAAPTYPRMPLATPFEALPQHTLVTQDHTVRGQTELSYWQRLADIIDMTGYAVAYVAATHGVPCHIVKAVSGYIQHEDPQYHRTRQAAHEALAAFLPTAIAQLQSEA